jgi:hypothetical protein
MSVDLRLRYVRSPGTAMLALESHDGTLHPIASISLDTTRAMPDAERAWRAILGCAIESAAQAAEASPCP